MNHPKKLILSNSQSPGDIVMLTAAVRDLHRTYPDQFLTDVRTGCPELWKNNPYITPIEETEEGVRVIECRYPLVNFSNHWPYHFLHGFIHYLNGQLKLAIRPWEIRGDIHLSEAEYKTPSQVTQVIGADIPYWIIVAGGKCDYTIKWWHHERFQEVVDFFQERILFVQVGHETHVHPPLRGVINLVGKTNLRELVLLVHHSDGILCPVTCLMHLAAAVPTKSGKPKLRPCVVVAGGREPPHWEAYPNHQFLHTVGMLPCCAAGGCWKARTVPIGDGDKKDEPPSVCSNITDDSLPRCMHMITARDVIRRIQGYFEGNVVSYLGSEHIDLLRQNGGIAQPHQ